MPTRRSIQVLVTFGSAISLISSSSSSSSTTAEIETNLFSQKVEDEVLEKINVWHADHRRPDYVLAFPTSTPTLPLPTSSPSHVSYTRGPTPIPTTRHRPTTRPTEFSRSSLRPSATTTPSSTPSPPTPSTTLSSSKLGIPSNMVVISVTPFPTTETSLFSSASLPPTRNDERLFNRLGKSDDNNDKAPTNNDDVSRKGRAYFLGPLLGTVAFTVVLLVGYIFSQHFECVYDGDGDGDGERTPCDRVVVVDADDVYDDRVRDDGFVEDEHYVAAVVANGDGTNPATYITGSVPSVKRGAGSGVRRSGGSTEDFNLSRVDRFINDLDRKYGQHGESGHNNRSVRNFNGNNRSVRSHNGNSRSVRSYSNSTSMRSHSGNNRSVKSYNGNSRSVRSYNNNKSVRSYNNNHNKSMRSYNSNHKSMRRYNGNRNNDLGEVEEGLIIQSSHSDLTESV